MHLIITGATGLVGSACLHQMLLNKSITRISILSRRPVPMAAEHSHVNVIIHKDFSAYSAEVLERLKGAEACIWALGISATKVSKRYHCNQAQLLCSIDVVV
jgi:NAD dependent epimerase/dehydratase family enzyme